MRNFELHFWHIGGCGGYPLSSKSILKVKKQMPLPEEHAHVPFLTKMAVLVSNLGLQSMSKHYEKPCRLPCLSLKKNSQIFNLSINQSRCIVGFFSAFWFKIIHFLPILVYFRHFPPLFTYIGPILTIFGNFSFYITWVSEGVVNLKIWFLPHIA